MRTSPDSSLRIMRFLRQGMSVYVDRRQVTPVKVRLSVFAEILVLPSSTIRFWCERAGDLFYGQSQDPSDILVFG